MKIHMSKSKTRDKNHLFETETWLLVYLFIAWGEEQSNSYRDPLTSKQKESALRPFSGVSPVINGILAGGLSGGSLLRAP